MSHGVMADSRVIFQGTVLPLNQYFSEKALGRICPTIYANAD